MFDNATLLITGGTGSFGNAVLKRFLASNIHEIRIFSRDEKKQHDMRESLSSDRVKFYLGDVRDPQSLEDAMLGVDFVFHAAALKEVPFCEFYPLEAVKTNVLGTSTVLEVTIKCGVQKVFCLSSTQAVYPINTMGISKAMLEKVMVANSRAVDPQHTLICATRLGNVMASSGSVIPRFVEQLKAGNPLTVTDPTMTRFMMSLDEAVELVVFAVQNAQSGDIFVQKSPACTLHTLTEALMRVFGVRSSIQIIGTRRGEKHYESLLTKEEFARAQDLKEYFRISADNPDLNYAKYFTTGDQDVTQAQEDYNSSNTTQLTVEQVVDKLYSLDYIQQELQTWMNKRNRGQF